MPIKFIVNTHQEAFDAVLRHLHDNYRIIRRTVTTTEEVIA